MKRNNGGFSLVEVVVAMAILGIFATASCTCLVLAHDMNGKTEGILQSRLAVSSAVETLMAEGIDAQKGVFTEGKRAVPGTPTDYIKDDEGNDIIFETGRYDDYKVTDNGSETTIDRFPNVTVTTERTRIDSTAFLPYYNVTVTSEDGSIEITTQVRKAYVAPPEDETDTEVEDAET